MGSVLTFESMNRNALCFYLHTGITSSHLQLSMSNMLTFVSWKPLQLEHLSLKFQIGVANRAASFSLPH